MTEKDLVQIETKLKITLPQAYRDLMLAQGASLQASGYFDDDLAPFFVDPQVVVRYNNLERPKGSGTGYAFPKWWQTFFLVGTNGGGDYYCLRLDNQPGVWLIGSDCGAEPSRVSRTLRAFVEKKVKERQQETREIEEAARQLQQQPTEEAAAPLTQPTKLPDVQFSWDFTWEHPTIGPREFKRRIQALGIDARGNDSCDESAVLEFADWLEAQGDAASARYVRTRCALDGKTPREDYATLCEQYLEVEFGFKPGGFPDFPGFLLQSGGAFPDRWWDDDSDGLEYGLPSFVNASDPRDDETCSGDDGRGAARLIRGLEALVRNTPVRGVDLQWYYPQYMAAILDSPGGRYLRRLAFSSRPAAGQTCPVIAALVKSPLTRSLERLEIQDGIQSDADALLLAGAPFERLQRLDLHAYTGLACSARTAVRLLSAPWFRQLHRVHLGFSEECCETGMLQLAGMPRLHTLSLWIPPDRQMAALSRAGEFPALKRLFIHHANLTGKYRESFARLNAPGLMEIWLRNSKLKPGDLRALTTTPLFDNLRALTFDGTLLNEAGLEAMANSVCAPELRILRVLGDSDRADSFRSLAGTSLTRPGAFPALTTLCLDSPFAKQATRDTAEFLKKLATPNLRHLTLTSCDLDDDGLDVLGNSPIFKKLTRLHIGNRIQSATPSAQALERLFRSPNLQNLIELRIDPLFEAPEVVLGKAVGVLLDEAVLPNLARGQFDTKEVPQKLIDEMKTKRPAVLIYQH